MIKIYACGGAGITLCVKMMPVLKENSNKEGFSEFKFNFLDTTDKNIQHFRINDNDVHIFKDNSFKSRFIDGSGSERRLNFDLISNGINDFLDNKKIANDEKNINIIIYSSGGGSGSVIGPLLHSKLLELNKPVLSFVIADTSSLGLIKNTINTLQTLGNLIKKHNKPVVVNYKVNNELNDDYKKSMEQVDSNILKDLNILSALFNKDLYNLDLQDIKTFLDYSYLKSLNIPNDLVELKISNKNIELKENEKISIIRTMSDSETSPEHNVKNVLHWKYGIISKEEVFETFKEKLPIHSYLVHNSLIEEIKRLKYLMDKNKEDFNKLNNFNFDITNEMDNVLINDDGFIL